MKKLILITLLMLGVLCSLMAETVYTIDTDYGQEQVIIPDGYTDTEVLLKIAKAYYELNRDYKDLRTETEELTLASETYIKDNQILRAKYQDLILDYEVLVKKLEQKNLLNWLKGYAGIRYTPSFKDKPGFGLSLGALVFNKILISASADYFMFDNTASLSIGAGLFF